MTAPVRIQRLLDGGQLESVERSDADVAALWEKAVRSARDARNPENSADNQYVLGYQALLQMGTAILAAAGYRTRGAQGHHANTFYAVAGLGIADLEEIDIRAERIRQMRRLSAYEPGSPSGEQLQRLHELVRTALPLARTWLVADRPHRRDELEGLPVSRPRASTARYPFAREERPRIVNPEHITQRIQHGRRDRAEVPRSQPIGS